MPTLDTREIKYDENMESLARASGYDFSVVDLAGKTKTDALRIKNNVERVAKKNGLEFTWFQREDVGYVLTR